MEKNEFTEMMKISKKADEFVEQLFLDNGYIIQKEVLVGKRRIDFLAEKDEKSM